MNCGTEFFQVGWVVPDIDAAIRRWVDSAGVGPFLVLRNVPVDKARYRGESVSLDFSIALAQAGSFQVELIEQHGGQASVYRDSVPEGQMGVHHVAALTADLDLEYERYRKAGIEVAYEGVAGDMRFAYFDTRDQVGTMTEYIQRSPRIVGLFESVAAVAQGWDGVDPIREVAY